MNGGTRHSFKRHHTHKVFGEACLDFVHNTSPQDDVWRILESEDAVAESPLESIFIMYAKYLLGVKNYIQLVPYVIRPGQTYYGILEDSYRAGSWTQSWERRIESHLLGICIAGLGCGDVSPGLVLVGSEAERPQQN